MPTGYTADIHDGKEITFPEFAMQCARAFGALILMRDDPKDAPIPDDFTPHTSYYDEQEQKALARLAELEAMTPEQIVEANIQARAEVIGQRAKAAKERRLLRQRYEAMLAEAKAWEPPTDDHQGLKKFMVEQIEESIRFDCTPVSWPPMPAFDPAEWFEEELAKGQRDLDYARQHRAEEIERTENRTGWVRALRESLGRTGSGQ